MVIIKQNSVKTIYFIFKHGVLCLDLLERAVAVPLALVKHSFLGYLDRQ